MIRGRYRLLSAALATAGLFLLLAMTAAGLRPAQAAAAAGSERVRAELLADAAAVQPGRTFWVALRLDIADGWHTYWRNPGDSGEPTHIDWRLPPGVEASGIVWPAPQRIPYGPLVNFGYHGRVILLSEVSVPVDWPADRPLDLEATASWLVCKDICIPEQADLSLTVRAGGGGDPAAAAEIAAAVARLPVADPGSRFVVRPAAAGASADELALQFADGAPFGDATSAYFFPDAWGAVDPVAPQRLERAGDGVRLLMTSGGEAPGDALSGVLVINPDSARGDPKRRAFAIDARRADEATGPGQGAASTGVGSATVGGAGHALAAGRGVGFGLFAALGLALVGGLLLNVMPCVFPILSMKAMGVIRHASDRRALRLSGLSYTAGILVFVGIVAGLLIGLKAAGEQIGWGFQLQSPTFVAAMALIVFALGLSLSGVFTLGAAAMGWGGLGANRTGPLGSFLTGALAALVATPCTAPFMGVALGFALTQRWPIALGVFLTLGLGLALPYLALTLVPRLAARLPRPGVWMDRIKQLLAFPLYLTAAWLVWVLSLQAGADAVLAVLVGMILLALAAWLFEIRYGLVGGRRHLLGAASLAAGVAAFAIAIWPQAEASPLVRGGLVTAASNASDPDAPAFEPFSPERLAALQAAGTPTFVNLTAAWCITCQVNERLALSSPRIADAFRARGIVYLKGDWTNRDPEITRLLDSFGRSGVPLYLVFQPGGDEPTVLPQLLTEGIVIDAIDNLPLVNRDGSAGKGSG
ncbi:MAG: thioredoxin family protein [Rhodospirillales bacterium]|nr:thioredoxin family protein [Rhodospirillales bacterium]